MKIHILPGDSLIETFKKSDIEGEIVVCRECLIDGPVKAENLEDFWRERENYLSANLPEPDNFYKEKVKNEFEKLLNTGAGDEINLWFEYELFCQTNMWFCLSLLKDKDVKIFRVAPVVRTETYLWKGFGDLSENDLERCFNNRIEFNDKDISLGAELWTAFQNKDEQSLKILGETKSKCFPHLKEVLRAAIQLKSRPEARVREIVAEGVIDFNEAFEKFKKTESVYGFGDLQVKRIFEQVVGN